MYLLSLSAGGLSLEFAEAEFGEVKARLVAAARDRGLTPKLAIDRGATLHTLRLGGEAFTLSFDDGDPCLIASGAVAEALLRAAVEQPDGRRQSLAAE